MGSKIKIVKPSVDPMFGQAESPTVNDCLQTWLSLQAVFWSLDNNDPHLNLIMVTCCNSEICDEKGKLVFSSLYQEWVTKVFVYKHSLPLKSFCVVLASERKLVFFLPWNIIPVMEIKGSDLMRLVQVQS